LIYPVGKHIGIRDAATHKMHFIQSDPNVKEITGLTMSNQQRRYLVVHEDRAHDFHSWISIYDMKNSQIPKNLVNKSFNLSELVYGSLRTKEI
jgi:hypothetical protein